MKKIAVIIPVSEFEDAAVVERSAQAITALDYTGLEVRVVYAVDVIIDEDKRVSALKQAGLEVFMRQRRGKRAGAINDAFLSLADSHPDYVALFDVDSRPARNFVTECVMALEREPMAYIASSRRYVSNPVNFVSRTVQAEYYILNFLLKRSAFKQFNGLIGVLRADLLGAHPLDEGVITEDADYATRLYAQGYHAVLVYPTRLHEQAPVSWRDLLNQRKRWYYGGLQLWRHGKLVRRSQNRKFVRAWILALTLSYCVILLLPFALIAPFVILVYPRGALADGALQKPPFSVSLGLMVLLLVLQYSAFVALLNFIGGRGVAWKPMSRVGD
jgi:cellulose synthase/poly-beta-1,6-N-acetylglucosamine synthase-like glycosyltransferase